MRGETRSQEMFHTCAWPARTRLREFRPSARSHACLAGATLSGFLVPAPSPGQPPCCLAAPSPCRTHLVPLVPLGQRRRQLPGLVSSQHRGSHLRMAMDT